MSASLALVAFWLAMPLPPHPPEAAPHFEAGLKAFARADYPAAVAAFQQAAAADPRNARYAHWLGKAWGRRAESSSFLTAPKYAVECRKAFEKAVELDPRYTEAWNDLLEYYLSAPGFLGGGMDKAARAVEKIGALDPVEKHYAQAKLAEAGKDLAAAEREFRAAAEAAPKQAGRWVDLAAFYARQKRLAESDEAFARALAAAAAAPATAHKTWYARAETLIGQRRNYAEARSLLDRYLAVPAASLAPDDPSLEDARKLAKKIPQ